MSAVADARRWWILSILCLSVLLVVVDNTIVNVALPTFSRKLSASTQDLQWVVDAYTLVFAALLLVGGNLGDRIGRRRILRARLVLFAVTSAGAALSRTSGELIAGRVHIPHHPVLPGGARLRHAAGGGGHPAVRRGHRRAVTGRDRGDEAVRDQDRRGGRAGADERRVRGRRLANRRFRLLGPDHRLHDADSGRPGSDVQPCHRRHHGLAPAREGRGPDLR